MQKSLNLWFRLERETVYMYVQRFEFIIQGKGGDFICTKAWICNLGQNREIVLEQIFFININEGIRILRYDNNI